MNIGSTTESVKIIQLNVEKYFSNSKASVTELHQLLEIPCDLVLGVPPNPEQGHAIWPKIYTGNHCDVRCVRVHRSLMHAKSRRLRPGSALVLPFYLVSVSVVQLPLFFLAAKILRVTSDIDNTVSKKVSIGLIYAAVESLP